MTIIKSLYFGRNKLKKGFGHRIHRSKKGRVKVLASQFAQRQSKQTRAIKEKKINRKILISTKQKLSTATLSKEIGV